MSEKKRYYRDKTFLNKKQAKELSAKYGTPLYVYDSKTLCWQVNRLYDAFSWNRGFRSFFPVRFLNNPHLLRVIHKAGCGVQCCNEVELRLAEIAGIPGADILFYACFPSFADWRKALNCGATIILDRGEQLEDIRLNEYGDRVVGLRLSTEGLITMPGFSRSGQHTKLGMEKQELFATAKRAVQRGFQRIGLYLSIGGESCAQGLLGHMTRALLGAARELYQELGIRAAWCNIGGDFVWSTEEHQLTTLDREAELIQKAYLHSRVNWPDWEDIPIFAEVGQFVSMPAGLLLTRVMGVKGQNNVCVGVDTSCAHMPLATRSGLYYHVSKPGSDAVEGRVPYNIVGTLPDPNDALKKSSLLHPIQMGELLLIHDMGGFGRASATNFCGTLRCPEVLMDENECRLISRRETFEDYIICLQGYQQDQKDAQEHCPQPQGDNDVYDLDCKA